MPSGQNVSDPLWDDFIPTYQSAESRIKNPNTPCGGFKYSVLTQTPDTEGNTRKREMKTYEIQFSPSKTRIVDEF